jgi:hypothetical protein
MKSPTKGLLFLWFAIVALQALCNGPVASAKSTFRPEDRFQSTKSLFGNLFDVGHIIQPGRQGVIDGLTGTNVSLADNDFGEPIGANGQVAAASGSRAALSGLGPATEPRSKPLSQVTGSAPNFPIRLDASPVIGFPDFDSYWIKPRNSPIELRPEQRALLAQDPIPDRSKIHCRRKGTCLNIGHHSHWGIAYCIGRLRKTWNRELETPRLALTPKLIAVLSLAYLCVRFLPTMNQAIAHKFEMKFSILIKEVAVATTPVSSLGASANEMKSDWPGIIIWGTYGLQVTLILKRLAWIVGQSKFCT